MWETIMQFLPMVLNMMNQGGTADVAGMGKVKTAPPDYYKTQGEGGGFGNILGKLGGLFGGTSSNASNPTTNTIGGQSPMGGQNQFIPPTMMASRQMPSYENIVQQMLAKQRGGM